MAHRAREERWDALGKVVGINRAQAHKRTKPFPGVKNRIECEFLGKRDLVSLLVVGLQCPRAQGAHEHLMIKTARTHNYVQATNWKESSSSRDRPETQVMSAILSHIQEWKEWVAGRFASYFSHFKMTEKSSPCLENPKNSRQFWRWQTRGSQLNR